LKNEIKSNNSNDLNIQKNQNYNEDLDHQIKNYVYNYKPHLAIMTPCYGGLCYTTYTNSLIQTIKLLESVGIIVSILFCNNDSLVSRARNNLVGSAMLTESITHMIFIDADITWNPIDIIKLIISDKQIIGGVYPKKSYDFKKITTDPLIINKWIQKKNSINIDVSDEEIVKSNLLTYNINYLNNVLKIENNITTVRHLATGFMMFKREVITKMIVNYPNTKYTDDTGFISPENSKYTYALFDCGIIDSHYYSEDWFFCHRWTELGGEIFLDISIDLTHSGNENYSGSFIRSIITSN